MLLIYNLVYNEEPKSYIGVSTGLLWFMKILKIRWKILISNGFKAYQKCICEQWIQSHASCSKAINYNGHFIYLWTVLE